MPNLELRNILTEGLEKLSLTCDESTCQKLIAYLELLSKWNHTYNLTAIREPRAMMIELILDSLSIAPFLHGTLIIDVGSGGGVPGIPLAIYNPDWQITLLDSNGKKTRFLTQASYDLGLKNVAVITSRVEDFQAPQKFNTVVTKAFSELANVLEKTQHLCDDNSQFLAMKGNHVAEELRKIPAGFTVTASHELTVPFLAKERYLVVCKKVEM